MFAQIIAREIGRELPHIAHFAWHKGTEMYDELKGRRELRGAQQERELLAARRQAERESTLPEWLNGTPNAK